MFRNALPLLLLCMLLRAGSAFAWAFAFCGDSRDDADGIFPQILSAVQNSDLEFLLHAGDMVSGGTPQEWEAFREIVSPLRKPLHPVIGNHEIHKGTRGDFVRFFGLPGTSYSFTHRDAHFAIVDNAGGELTEDTLSWLARDLAAHPLGAVGVSAIVVAMHFPPRTAGINPHGAHRDYEEQSGKLLGILQRHRVDLLLCGHEHMHFEEDWEGVRVIVSGGAGAPLVPLQPYGFYRIDVEENGIRAKFQRVHPAGK
jgi:3',5'-cyclic AMP phosphodiesterase CpdA